MPDRLGVDDIEALEPWPLGSVMTRRAKGECWTDVLAIVASDIRLGGRFNSRRVRYDGTFYIMHNARRVEFDDALSDMASDLMQHVYGVDAAQDARHNTRMKGY